MIKFDLERALAGDKVFYMDGNEVTQLAEFKTDEDSTLIGVMEDSIHYFIKKDLHMAPKPLSGLVNVYKSITTGQLVFVGSGAILRVDQGHELIACIDLSQHNEGEGLE